MRGSIEIGYPRTLSLVFFFLLPPLLPLSGPSRSSEIAIYRFPQPPSSMYGVRRAGVLHKVVAWLLGGPVPNLPRLFLF